MKRLTLALLALVIIASPAEARHRHHRQTVTTIADPGCNIIFPCYGVAPSPRGEIIARKVGFGRAQNHYVHSSEAVIGGRPAGCPHAFCGCGASLHIFGRIIPSLNLAANWLGFPRAEPAPGMAAARHGHVWVLEEHVAGDVWIGYDANSGGGLTRRHARSITGYTIVNPHGSNRYASL
jgi:hypothetical protein